MLLRDLCISQGDPVPSCFSFTLPLPPAFSSLSLLHLPSCSYSYFSLIASSEPCSSPLTWRLLPTSSWLLRPYKDLPPITNHSSSQFPFAHSGTNHFQEGIARGLCHRLHIFCVLWTPPQRIMLTAMQYCQRAALILMPAHFHHRGRQLVNLCLI